MLKRAFSITLIFIFLTMSAVITPLCNSGYFTYADTETEELSEDEVLSAAIATYLNARNGWIVNATGNSIDTVQSVMESWINSAEFWKNTTVGGIAVFYANCVVKYNPFRISLKGPAVRALNDLYDWLKDTGKLSNLENSEGGTTTNNLYNGYFSNGSIFWVFDTNSANDLKADTGGILKSKVTTGTIVDGYTGKILQTAISNANPDIDVYSAPNSSITFPSFTINFYPNYTYTGSSNRVKSTTAAFGKNLTPFLCVTNSSSTSAPMYSNIYGNIGYAAHYHITGESANRFHDGIVSYDPSTSKYIATEFRNYYSPATVNVNNANVNLFTDDFDKTEPNVPQNDDEITYTPQDKTTNQYFNTYNDYITNYVKKNTIINKNYMGDYDPYEPEDPGGTTPPWTDDNENEVGNIVPDGNNGYNFTLPDLTIPDLDIDWSISGLKNKFPFSIPFDLLAFFMVLNAEPETPEIQAQVDLGIIDWDIDWSLEEFNGLAALLRNLEFIGFCIALILITRNIIKG